MNHLGTIDYFTILAYLVGIAAVGVRVARRQKTTEQYFLAGRRMPGWVVAFSIIGTVISSVSFVALPGAAFDQGWRLIMANLMVPIVLVFVTIVVVPFYRRVVRMSGYEYLERRFGVGARLYGSLGFLLLRIVDLGFTLLTTAVAVEVIAGWDIRLVILGIGLFTLSYTLIGGIEAVVWNDVPQGLVLGSGALCLLFLVLFRPEGGPAAVISTAWQGGRFDLGDFSLSPESLFRQQPTAWLLMLSGLAHFGRAYITEQNIVQRYLVARSDRDAQRATLTGAMMCVVIWLTFSFIGSSLWAFYRVTGNGLPEEIFRKPDNIVPYFISTQFPQGLVGLVLAAILAAAMQAFSADLASVATVATQDYYARFFPHTSDHARLRFGRLAVLTGGLFATGVALQLTQARAQAIYGVVITLFMILSGGMLGLFALGFLTTAANRRGAYGGIAACVFFVGWATLTGPLKVDLGWNFRMHPILIGVLSHPVLFLSGYAASRLLGGAPADLTGLTAWTKGGGGPGR